MPAKNPEMHKSFPDWYRAAGVDPAAQPLEERWKAVSDIAGNASAAAVCDLVRLAYDVPAVHDSTIPWLEDAVRKHDAAAPLEGHDYELRVIAGAALLTLLLGAPSYRADLAALALSSAAFMGWSPVLDGLAPTAQVYLETEAVRVRAAEEPDVQSLKAGIGKAYDAAASALRKLATSHKDAASESPTFEDLEPVLAAYLSALNALRETVPHLEALETAVSVAREESELLWWFETLSIPSGARHEVIGLALGLAERTRHLPILPGAEQLVTEALSRASVETADASIADQLNGADRKSLSDFADIASDERDLTPLAHAAARAREVPEGGPWVDGASAVTRVDLAKSLPPAAACVQMYRELMLVRAFEAV